ncbi:reprolysin-like metallopeptidase [Luteibacter sp. CQ10]|uniref:reprolysin-like metallopeptidase n=1 Tax=Luteibacter sp. CQ10 TaxID=2805821 RepID=UPI0034A4C35C
MKQRGWVALAASLACVAAGSAVWRDRDRVQAPAVAADAGSGPSVAGPDAPDGARISVDKAVHGRGATSSAGDAALPLLALTGSEPPRREGVFTWYPVRIDEKRARAAMTSGGRLSIPTPGGSRMSLAFEHAVDHGDGNWSWVGKPDGVDDTQRAVITFGPDATVATLPDSEGRRLTLTTQGGQTFLVSAPLSSLHVGVNPLGDGIRPVQPVGTVGALDAADQPLANAVDTAKAGAGGATTVDVLAVYSSGFRKAKGSASAAVTALTNRFDVANQVLRNSQVNASFRMVRAQEAQAPDDTDNTQMLESIRTGTPWIQTMRDQSGADLVTFVREYDAANNGCGVAYIPPGDYANDAGLMYSVVSDGSLPTGYYCEATTLAHELAHNLGAQHNHEQDATGGLFPYSYGYRNFAAQFYDVMAYGPDANERIWTYSNPSVTLCKGLPCGVVDYADVARTLRYTMPIAAGFRATKVPAKP